MKTLWWLALLSLSLGCDRTDSRRVLDVYAASSLNEAFSELAAKYEHKHPDVDVRVTYAGSQILRLQVEHGARPDVFASANPHHVSELSAQGLLVDATPFASNELVVIVPPDSNLNRFEDISEVGRLVIGSPEVPIGAYTDEMLRKASDGLASGFAANVRRRVVSRETNVRMVRAKVEIGEADAAVVYRTDAQASDRVRAVEIPRDYQVAATYALGRLTASSSPDGPEFIRFVLSAEAQQVLRRRAFSEVQR